MSQQITAAFVQKYTDGVMSLVQQRKSRFRDCVRVETGIVGKTAFFDQVGATEMEEQVTRHDDTPQIDTPHARRMVAMRTFRWADLIDDPDKVATINDFQAPYMANAASAAGRKMDDLIIAAAFATAATGETGTGTASLATAQTISWGSSSLTIAKLITAKQMLDEQENDPDEPRFIACQAKQITNLLNTTQITSSDFNTVKALVQGQIDTFLGFKFIRTERLPLDSGGQRRCFAWRKSALCLGISQDIVGRVSERPDKNYATQVFFRMKMGATRMEEAGVVDIRVTA